MHEVTFLTLDLSTDLSLPFVDGGIPAGFPSPAQDYVDGTLDLNRELVEHPAATFYARVDGHSMEPGILCGDILVVDRSLEACDGSVAVCYVNGEFTIKRLDLTRRQQGVIRLVPDNPAYPPLEVSESEHFEIWGVVRYVIHKTV